AKLPGTGRRSLLTGRLLSATMGVHGSLCVPLRPLGILPQSCLTVPPRRPLMCLRVVCICTVTAGCMVSWLVGRPLFGADESPVAAKTAGSTPGENQPSHDSAPGKIDFARQIRPILSDNCFYC